MGELRILSYEGDSKIIWDIKNKDEVEAAKLQFDALKKKDYVAYAADKEGNKGKVMKVFDPKAGKIIMVPPITGG